MDPSIFLFILPFGSSKNIDSITSFFAKLDYYCKENNKDDDFKMRHPPFLLEGKCHRMFMNFNKLLGNAYAEVALHLKQIFGEVSLPIEAAYPIFSNLKMSSTDSVNSFFENLLNISHGLNVSSEIIKCVFVNGLQDYMKPYVRLHKPNTLFEAVNLAKIAEYLGPENDYLKPFGGNTDIKELLKDLRENVNSLENSLNSEISIPEAINKRGNNTVNRDTSRMELKILQQNNHIRKSNTSTKKTYQPKIYSQKIQKPCTEIFSRNKTSTNTSTSTYNRHNRPNKQFENNDRPWNGKFVRKFAKNHKNLQFRINSENHRPKSFDFNRPKIVRAVKDKIFNKGHSVDFANNERFTHVGVTNNTKSFQNHITSYNEKNLLPHNVRNPINKSSSKTFEVNQKGFSNTKPRNDISANTFDRRMATLILNQDTKTTYNKIHEPYQSKTCPTTKKQNVTSIFHNLSPNQRKSSSKKCPNTNKQNLNSTFHDFSSNQRDGSLKNCPKTTKQNFTSTFHDFSPKLNKIFRLNDQCYYLQKLTKTFLDLNPIIIFKGMYPYIQISDYFPLYYFYRAV